MNRVYLNLLLDNAKVKEDDEIRFLSSSGLEWHIEKIDLKEESTKDAVKKRIVLIRMK